MLRVLLQPGWTGEERSRSEHIRPTKASQAEWGPPHGWLKINVYLKRPNIGLLPSTCLIIVHTIIMSKVTILTISST